MKFYIISPPDYNENFSAENFDKITDLIPVEYFQFRPKFSKLFERKKFIKKFHNSFSKICKNKNIKLIINNDFEIAKDFFLMGSILVKMIKAVEMQKKNLVVILL